MSSAIKAKILEDMKTAMRNKDKERLAVIRLIQAAMKQREVDERIELTNEQVLATLNKMLKQRRDSIKQFTDGGRPDLAEKENNEIAFIQTYLPEQLSEADIEKEVISAIKESAASSAKDMGKVMALLKSTLQGKADMSLVSSKVKEKLQ